MSSRSEREFTKALGANLRALRQSRGMSLGQVQEKSGGVWLAVVVGSYERGDRQGATARISALCEWYGASLAQVLPGSPVDDAVVRALAERVAVGLVSVVQDWRLAGDPEGDTDPDDEAAGDAVPAQREYVGGVA